MPHIETIPFTAFQPQGQKPTVRIFVAACKGRITFLVTRREIHSAYKEHTNCEFCTAQCEKAVKIIQNGS